MKYKDTLTSKRLKGRRYCDIVCRYKYSFAFEHLIKSRRKKLGTEYRRLLQRKKENDIKRMLQENIFVLECISKKYNVSVDRIFERRKKDSVAAKREYINYLARHKKMNVGRIAMTLDLDWATVNYHLNITKDTHYDFDYREFQGSEQRQRACA